MAFRAFMVSPSLPSLVSNILNAPCSSVSACVSYSLTSTALCLKYFLRHFKGSFSHPASSFCLPSITVCVPTSPVSQLSCFDCLLSLWTCSSQAGMKSAHSASPGPVPWVASVDIGWVELNRKDSPCCASASWEGTTDAPFRHVTSLDVFRIFLSMDTSLSSNHCKSASQTWLDLPNE